MELQKVIFSIIIISLAILLPSGTGYGYDDGFGSAEKIEGKNVVLYRDPAQNISSLIHTLNIRISDEILTGKTAKKKLTPEEELVDMADTLYMRVSDIADMHLYSLQVSVKICRNYDQLSGIYNNLFNSDLCGKKSFYVYTLNTIYISADDFKYQVLGHEIAHAIISHYFVVPPSVKIQEVLAMYVEFNLRETGR